MKKISTMKKISYSGITSFCTCRRAYYYHYIKNLVPIATSENLIFGKAWHETLEKYYFKPYLNYLIESPDYYLSAMFKGYRKQYQNDRFSIISAELPFEIFIRPPHEGRAARGVRFRGVIDLVIEHEDGVWIMEHKTARTIDDKYLSKLWHDFQIMLYAYAYQEMTGKKVQGIIYNVVKKTSIKQKEGETPEEYNTRYIEACAKAKGGKSSAKRKMPETDEDFQERLNEQYDNPEMFHREEILCTERRLKEVKKELWELNKAMRTDDYYKNRAQCFVYGECQYFKICNSGENPVLIENHYKERENYEGTRRQKNTF